MDFYAATATTGGRHLQGQQQQQPIPYDDPAAAAAGLAPQQLPQQPLYYDPNLDPSQQNPLGPGGEALQQPMQYQPPPEQQQYEALVSDLFGSLGGGSGGDGGAGPGGGSGSVVGTTLADHPIQPTGDVDSSAFLTALSLNAVLFVVLISLYELCRRLLPEVYAGRAHHVPDDDIAASLSAAGSGAGGAGRRGKSPSWLPLSWIKRVYQTSWSTVRRTGGLDAYMFLRYIRLCLRVTSVAGFWSMAILGPIYFAGGNGAQGWYHLSMANLRQGSYALWIPCAFMWIFTMYVGLLMNGEYKHYVDCRMEYLSGGGGGGGSISAASDVAALIPGDVNGGDDKEGGGAYVAPQSVQPQQRTVVGTNRHNRNRNVQHLYSIMVERVPYELRSDRALFDYFEALFPGKVHSACVVMNLPELESASNRRWRIVRRLDKSNAYYEATGRRPTHVVGRGRFRCCGIESLPFFSFGGRSSSVDDAAAANASSNASLSSSSSPRSYIRRHRRSQPSRRGERVDSIDYYTRELSEMNDAIATLQAEKLDMAARGNEELRASQWISHAIGVASDAAAATLTGQASRSDGLILGFGDSPSSSDESFTACGIIRQVGLDFFLGGFAFLHHNLDDVVDTVVGTTMSSTAFVTFKDLSTVTCAVRAPLCHKPDVLMVSAAPEPNDIQWENCHISVAWTRGRAWTANVLLGLGAILWSIPVASIQALATVDSLATILPWIEKFNGGRFAAFVNGYLPVVALLVIIILLPVVFEWVAINFEDRKTHSDVQKSILGRYFYYQLANIYITVTAGSLWDSLAEILDHPSNAFSILGKSLPTVVGYFTTLLMTKVLAGLPMVMLRFGAFSRMLFLKLCFREKWLTQSELDEVYKKQMLKYGWEYPTQLLVIVICFTYSCISPVILPVGAIYFFGALLVYKKQVLVVYTPTHEGGGEMFPSVCHRTLVGLVCAQMTLIGYSILREGFYQALALFPLPVFTISLMSIFNRLYADRGKHLSLEKAIELDVESVATSFFREDVYRQPVLAEKGAEPQPYRRSGKSRTNDERLSQIPSIIEEIGNAYSGRGKSGNMGKIV